MRASEFVQEAPVVVDESDYAMDAIKSQERVLKVKKARQKANDSLRKLHDAEAKPAVGTK